MITIVTKRTTHPPFKSFRFGKTSAEKESVEWPDQLTRGYFDPHSLIEVARQRGPFLFLGCKGSGKDRAGVPGTTSSRVPASRPGLPECRWATRLSTLSRILAATTALAHCLLRCSREVRKVPYRTRRPYNLHRGGAPSDGLPQERSYFEAFSCSTILPLSSSARPATTSSSCQSSAARKDFDRCE